MEQLDLFTSQPDLIPTYHGIRANVNGSASGNSWHSVCETRLIGYGFKRLESRKQVGDALEFDGWLLNGAGLHVLAEYKERIYQRTFKEIVGQAYCAHALQRSKRMVVIVLAGYIDPNLTEKETLINTASDLIYYVGNPQNPDAETFLKRLAYTKPEEVASITYDNLTARIRKLGGFPALHPPRRLH